MCFDNIKAKYSCLISFLLGRKLDLLQPPYKGRLWIILPIYKNFCIDCIHGCWTNFVTLDEFRLFLDEFNEISARSLQFGYINYEKHESLVWIDLASILILKQRLSEENVRQTGGESDSLVNLVKCIETSPKAEPESDLALGIDGKLNLGKADFISAIKTQLVDILEQPLHTTLPDGEVSARETTLDQLLNMLAEPTAITQLEIQRAQILTEKKQFYEVCEVAAHNQTLSNLCFNSKAIGQSVLDLPSNTKTHRVILSCKSLIGKDVLNCVKTKIHYLPLVTSSTELYLGNCSYLDTCHKLKSCRYLHFYTLYPPLQKDESRNDPKSGF